MARIRINFTAMWHMSILAGKKICTVRCKRLGDVGDVFPIEDRDFVLTSVESMSFFACRNSSVPFDEGIDDVDSFIGIMKSYYSALHDNTTVYVHYFNPINNGAPNIN